MNYIVTTTIQKPTEATLKFASMPDWHLIVVGDLKTPHNEYRALKNITYLSPEDQDKMDFKLSEAIGWNKIQRRNFGFIEAYKRGDAFLVATVDDDNIPYDNWGKNILVGQKDFEYFWCETQDKVFDPLSATNHNQYWHRGFPLSLLRTKNNIKVQQEKNERLFAIQANLWDGDPDIDAFCRLEHAPECKFRTMLPFAGNKFSPFNSQNTILHREVLPHYMMLPFVGRADDIWPSYYVQSLGFEVIYDKATVYQDRNEQNLMKNLNDEFLMYEKTLQLIEKLEQDPQFFWQFLPDRTAESFRLYQKNFK